MDDYRWLVSDEGGRWLAEAAATSRPLVPLTNSLRRSLTAERTHLVLEQVALRRHAADKFSQAAQMFFTRPLLEQATDECIAACKSLRFPRGGVVADLCCGLGGDLLALGRRGAAVGSDRSAIAALLAEANCRACGVTGAMVRVQDAAAASVGAVAAWHLDPDRRAAGRRTTQLAHYEPGPPVISRLLGDNPRGAVKLAPAAAVPQQWAEQAELGWIGSRGECRQQVAWFGDLARCPGQRSATIADAADGASFTCRGLPDREPLVAAAVGRYVYEPNATILAARLTGEIAARHQLLAIAAGVGYLTADQLVQSPALACFEVTDVLPFDEKRVQALLRQRRIGRLEVKKRAVRVLPEQWQKRFAGRGEHAGVLIITPQHGSAIAVLARRVPDENEAHSGFGQSAPDPCPSA